MFHRFFKNTNTNCLMMFISLFSCVSFGVHDTAVVTLPVSLLICLKHILNKHLPSTELVKCSAAFPLFIHSFIFGL